jgi:hypothetical protein
MAKLQDFMLSRVRVKLLKTFLTKPNEMFYVRQLTRITSEEINAVRRELSRMVSIGFIKSEKRGNRLYYYPSKSYDYYSELLSLVAKSTNLGHDIRKNKNKIGKIKFAVLSTKYVRHLERLHNEVDLLVVGTVILPELAKIVKKEEARRKIEMNYTVMTQEEFKFRKDRRDPFLLGILQTSRIMLLGDEEDLLDKKPVEHNTTNQ